MSRKQLLNDGSHVRSCHLLVVGVLAFCHLLSYRASGYYMLPTPQIRTEMFRTKLYFFNLTNQEEFLIGIAKPKVVEVGPYVFGEVWNQRNITIHPNDTVSARFSKTLFFIREESAGPDTDLITTLNVPMISAADKARYQDLLMRLTTSSLLEVFEERPIIVKSVHGLVFGYQDPLLKLAKDFQPPGQSLPFESFGYFVGVNNTEMTVLTERDIAHCEPSASRRLPPLIDHDSRLLPFWNTRQCNMINGSDGTVYPPGANESSTVYLFARDICRSMPLRFEQEVVHSGVRTLRFTPPEDVFDSVDTKPDNMCFCVGGPPCAPKGLFNISACQYGSPMFVSFPHFYLADPSIPAKLDDVSPSKEKHQFFIDLVPGADNEITNARNRVQINFHIGPVPDVLYTQRLPDMFYPVLWMEREAVPQTLITASDATAAPCYAMNPCSRAA